MSDQDNNKHGMMLRDFNAASSTITTKEAPLLRGFNNNRDNNPRIVTPPPLRAPPKQEDEEEVDECDSLLAQAIASNQPVQIMRIAKPNHIHNHATSSGGSGGISIVSSFFGGQDDAADQPNVVTALPASFKNMRRVRRARSSEKLAARFPPGLAPLRRCNTGDVAMMVQQHQHGAPSSPKNNSHTKPNNSSRIGLSNTYNPHGGGEGGGRDNNNSANAASYATHQETIDRLKVQNEDIQKILDDPLAFAKLQKVLRKHGAVTNEVLKQVLPLYVKHQVNSQAAKEAAAAKPAKPPPSTTPPAAVSEAS